MSPVRPDRVKILIVGYRKFSELINAVSPEFSDEAEVTIFESLAHGNAEYHSLVARHGPDVVASAGSNAAYLANTLSEPVISQPVTDTDIIDALAKASRISKNIHLFTYQPDNAPPSRLFNSLPGLLDINLVHHCYSTSDEANERLQLAVADELPGVVVGPSYTCHMAEQQGLSSILLYSKESARVMLREAIVAGRAHQGHHRDAGLKQVREHFVIRSQRMARLAEMASTYARSAGAVLIEGESGTGKEHIAKEIHRQCDYSEGPMVAVNCGSIPNDLFESELFGHVDGAFTSARRGGRVGLVEQANGGTLYLDEVGEMPVAQQAKLLRVLQEKRIRPLGSNQEISLDFKLIAATNCDLSEAVAAGEFRDDLYYRLNVLSLKIPPLRERPEDIDAIARYYLGQYSQRYQASADMTFIYDQLGEVFKGYYWPGNVRQLQNFVERVVVNYATRPKAALSAADIAEILPELSQSIGSGQGRVQSLRGQEEMAIKRAMKEFAGDKSLVAESLGISTTTLWRRLRDIQSTEQGESEQFLSGNQSGK